MNAARPGGRSQVVAAWTAHERRRERYVGSFVAQIAYITWLINQQMAVVRHKTLGSENANNREPCYLSAGQVTASLASLQGLSLTPREIFTFLFSSFQFSSLSFLPPCKKKKKARETNFHPQLFFLSSSGSTSIKWGICHGETYWRIRLNGTLGVQWLPYEKLFPHRWWPEREGPHQSGGGGKGRYYQSY